MGLLARVSRSSPNYKYYLAVSIFITSCGCVTAILVLIKADAGLHGLCSQAALCRAMRAHWYLNNDQSFNGSDLFLVRLWLALSGLPSVVLYFLFAAKTILRTKADMKAVFVLFVLLIPNLLILFGRNPVFAPDTVRSIADWGRWLGSLAMYYLFEFLLTLICVSYLSGDPKLPQRAPDAIK
jgi:hypothetical protein